MVSRIALTGLLLLALAAGGALAESDAVKGPFAGTVHAVGNLTYKDGSQKTLDWDRGRITALSDSSVTLTRRDKVQVSFAITSGTAVRNDGATYGLSDVKVGLVATVVSEGGNADVIRNLRGDGAPSGAEPGPFDGPAARSVTGSVDAQYVDGSHQQFDYNRGRITDLDNGSLTIKRADGQSVTFSYDSNTLVRERGGSVGSVDDLEVGEGAMFFSQSDALKLVRCISGPGPQPEARKQGQGGQGRGARLQAALQARLAGHSGAPTAPAAATAS